MFTGWGHSSKFTSIIRRRGSGDYNTSKGSHNTLQSPMRGRLPKYEILPLSFPVFIYSVEHPRRRGFFHLSPAAINSEVSV